MPPVSTNAIDIDLLKEVEQFLFHEAELLDDRRFDDWLALLADDIQYVMPISRSVGSEAKSSEVTHAAREVCWFDDDKATLAQRVRQIGTGEHWAEEPASRVCRLITNMQIDTPSVSEVTARDRFLIYQNRLETDQTFFVGRRESLLRRLDERRLQIVRRTIWLSQSVLLAQNLSIFF